MKLLTTTKSFLALALFLSPLAARANPPVKSIPLAPRIRPESITRAFGGKYYVSIQGTPDANKPDGEIIQLDVATGAITPFVPAGGVLVNPRGLAFTGEYLVVTDTTKVWKIDKAGKVTPLAEQFPYPPIFFNDAAPERGGKAVFVSEMGPGRTAQRDPKGNLWPVDSTEAEAIPTGARVYRITLDGKVTNTFTPTRKVLITNGIAEARAPKGAAGNKGGKHLLAFDMFHGSVVDVDLQHDQASILATGAFRGGDGLEQGKDGTIYLSSIDTGRVWRMDSRGENVKKLLDVATDLKTEAHMTLADLALDEEAGVLYVPDTLHGTILVVKTQ